MLSPDYCYYLDKEGGPKTPICHWKTNRSSHYFWSTQVFVPVILEVRLISIMVGMPFKLVFQLLIMAYVEVSGWPDLFIRVSLFMPWIRSVISGTDVHIEAEANEQLTTEDNLLITVCLIIGFITLFVNSALIWCKSWISIKIVVNFCFIQ